MKVVYVPGLEDALKDFIRRYAVTKDGGKIPVLLIPDEIARKTDLAGFLTSVPAATTGVLGGVKLYSGLSSTVGDRTHGRSVNDTSGYLRLLPATVQNGQHWAGVVNVFDTFETGATYAFTDVYNCDAINTAIGQLVNRLVTLENWKTTTESWKTTYASKVSALENAKKQADEKIAALESANTALASRVKALEDAAAETNP